MGSRIYPAIGWGLAVLAFLAVLLVIVETAIIGFPSPLSLVTALLLTSSAVSWPFLRATQDVSFQRPMCRECGSVAWGFQEFHFCIHCGSTRQPISS